MEETDSQETSSQTALDFIDSSSLTYFIPQATKFRLEDEFNGDGDKPSEDIFKSIETRESLFFDESVDVYLVLRTALVQEHTLRSYLRRLVITLETQVVSGNALERDHPPNSEVIYSGTVDEAEDPVILADKSSGDGESSEGERYIYAVWKLPVFLARPRMRLQSPTAIFTATASLKPAAADLPPSTTSSGGGGGGDYMPSGVPSGLNLLEAFGNDPALNGVVPRLSALRVSRVAPVTQQAKDLLRPIRTLPKLSLRVYPAVHSRIRFSRPPSSSISSGGGGAVIIAMLEIDFTPFFDCEILLDATNVAVRGGGGGVVVDNLTSQAAGDGGGLSMPLSCVAHDHVTFLYRIAPAAEAADVVGSMSKSPSRELDISISATALVEPGVCEPRLRMAWSATVDFTLPLNPGYGPALQPIQRSHRPSQLSIGGTDAAAAASLTAPAVSRPDSIPSLEAAAARSRETSFPELGITVTFAGPPATQKIYPGDTFAWTVFVVNRAPPAPARTPTTTAAAAAAVVPGAITPSASPRKLALVAIPRRRRHDARVNRPPSVSSSQVPFSNNPNNHSISGHAQPHGGYDKRVSLHQQQQQPQQQHPPLSQPASSRRDRAVADAVLDDAVVHAMQRGSSLGPDCDSAPLASLSADVRVGPLAPGACHAAELRFLALRAGVHAVELVRVVDLGSNEHVDVRELPVVVVESR